jgi:hypothetical protein
VKGEHCRCRKHWLQVKHNDRQRACLRPPAVAVLYHMQDYTARFGPTSVTAHRLPAEASQRQATAAQASGSCTSGCWPQVHQQVRFG